MSEILCCPVYGELVNLSDVSDEMFSQRMIGDGIAIKPIGNEIISPIDATVTMIYESKHAIALTTSLGTEILLHIGLDTVMMKGLPFETKVSVGDIVKKGSLLTIVDLDMINKENYDTITPVIVINKKVKPLKMEGKIELGEAILEID